jgi:hypothetical protein
MTIIHTARVFECDAGDECTGVQQHVEPLAGAMFHTVAEPPYGWWIVRSDTASPGEWKELCFCSNRCILVWAAKLPTPAPPASETGDGP